MVGLLKANVEGAEPAPRDQNSAFAIFKTL